MRDALLARISFLAVVPACIVVAVSVWELDQVTARRREQGDAP
jgi:hypothetical protein